MERTKEKKGWRHMDENGNIKRSGDVIKALRKLVMRELKEGCDIRALEEQLKGPLWAQVENCLVGRTTTARLMDDDGRPRLEKGVILTHEILSSIPRKYWWEILTSIDQEIKDNIDRIMSTMRAMDDFINFMVDCACWDEEALVALLLNEQSLLYPLAEVICERHPHGKGATSR